MHRLLHQQGRCDDALNGNHTQLQRCATGGSPDSGRLCVRLQACRRTHSQDSPSDRHGIRLSGNPHQRAYCELQVEDLLLKVISAPIPWETQGHRRCLHDRVHAPESTNSYNSSALVG